MPAKPRLPSVWPPLIASALSHLCSVVALSNVLYGGGLAFVGAAMIFCFGGMMWWQGYKTVLLQRKQIRDARVKEVFAQNWPSPTEHQPNWDELERGVEALLAKGVEPTVERAEMWIAKERKREAEIECKRIDQEINKPFLRPTRPGMRRVKGYDIEDGL